MRLRLIIGGCFLWVLCAAQSAGAVPLSYVSDLISTSAPGATSTHAIQFTLGQTIPASGIIFIQPIAGAFTIPGGFDYTNVEFAVATSGPYVDRTLAASPDASHDGVTVAGDSSLTITLSSGSGLAAGEKVRVVLSNGSDPAPQNPFTTGSYRIAITTNTQTNAPIDQGSAMIAIVPQVGVSAGVIQHPPKLSNGLPAGTVAAGSSVVEISVETDEFATCRFATSTGIAYAQMQNQFPQTLQQVFYTTLTGFENNTTYTYYVRCISAQGDIDTDDYPISFTLEPDPISNTSVASTQGSSGHGGVGDFIDGSAYLYQGSVSLAGAAPSGASVTILVDGKPGQNVTAGADGTFKANVTNLERGIYTFSVFATDQKGNKTGTDSETLNVGSGSSNAISGILLPPTVELSSSNIGVGERAQFAGSGVPNSTTTLDLTDAAGNVQTFVATSSVAGDWSLEIPGTALKKGTYTATARSRTADSASVAFTGPITLGVGTATGTSTASGGKGDMNGDGKVNLVDFSIMLSNWGTADPASDINHDGTVNLADFSILLFNWTG
ncbi:MAG TPA: dockerin type I domain-containing protein [Candidatus Paceibacterota bacterium]|nr:dockerin type I domain-containing protein [Candidatus Paceibacterota bacterium]